ncbi:penicillin-binding protein 1C [Flavicella sediminum]|uniref:penicillin-binding protein 1C n=1 Tax=Flavicella sediminum TaxID=2585141 RepID=UPI00111FBA13|nr:penicillin-binding protein 1C [Flavicella sediminum]
MAQNRTFVKRHKIKLLVGFCCLLWFYFCLPEKLFNDPKSTVIESREGVLLGAKIAKDGQWRFPENKKIPVKFEECILAFEDAYFYKHFGFNPVSIAKAIVKNSKSKRIKRGGSTLTQQVIRLSRKGKKRSYFEKLKEVLLAIRLEFRSSKKEILSHYVSNAPFGGNVVGLEAASWRYYACAPQNLSWGETATLAVLPNAPSLIYPGKNQYRLLEKRNRLLRKLWKTKVIDSLTCSLASLESVPQKPHSLPQIAPHLLAKIDAENPIEKVKTSLDIAIQQQVNAIVSKHYKDLQQNNIYNMSVLVLDVKTRKVLGYVGNTPTDKLHQKDVNIIHKARSTGSILKPLLYAGILDAGVILPNTLIADVPTQIASYNPKNFNLEYDGAVPASKALSRSLNVPAVKMLQEFGVDRFHDYLKKMKLTDIKYHSSHYGLSLILGGAESNLWDLCKTYAAFSGTINHYEESYGKYFSKEFVAPSYYENEKIDFGKASTEKTIFDAGSLFLTYTALREVNRPQGEENWEFFDSSKEIAWKTGTSFGFRDAWAIGSTKDYVVGVWVGNADGEGRPGLTGVSTAGPVLFDVFDTLPSSTWFEEPSDELAEVVVCGKSGYRAKEICTEKDTVLVQLAGLDTKPCPYHRWVHVTENEQYQVNTSCQPLNKIKHKSWFVLPPLMEFYYRQKNPFYKTLPNYRRDCFSEKQRVMDFVYPKDFSKIFLPKDFDGSQNQLVVKLAHSISDTKVFWYVNEKYLGETNAIHEKSIAVKPGKYVLTVVDEFGNELKRNIEIVD